MSFFKTKRLTTTLRRPLTEPAILEIQRCSSNPSPSPSPSPCFASMAKTKSNKNNNNKNLTYYQHLISICLRNNRSKSQRIRLEQTLHSELIYGWDISQNIDRIFYRLKPISTEINRIIVMENINDVLLYSLDKFLNLNMNKEYNMKFKWVYNVYLLLMDSMTLEQKAMLFCKCSNRKNRKYKLIHQYKDCIVGKQGIDFLVNKQICKNRKAAIDLGQEMIDKGYMSHVCNKHGFKDSNNLWYKFDDENIKYWNEHIIRYSDDDELKGDDYDYNDEEDGYCSNLSSDEEDNNFLLNHLGNNINIKNIKIDGYLHRLGLNHDAVIEWLLSLYPINDIQIMFDSKLKELINSPNISLAISSTECVYFNNDDIINDDNNYNKSEDELFIPYHNRMVHTMSNKYTLNVKPFTMNNITNKEREKLLSVQQIQFDSYLNALKFILCELWDIYNHIIKGFYIKFIDQLSLIEKAKMLSIAVERKNRFQNLQKYKNCFIGKEAVTFLINSKLADNRASAVYLGNIFYKNQWIKHVKNESMFEDKDLFYMIIEDELENRLDELRLYRKQQASNHVNISLDIVTSPKSINYIHSKIGSSIYGEEGEEDSDEISIDYHENAKSPPSSYSIKSISKHTKSNSIKDIQSYL